jgi:hypothetical protein
MGYAPRILSQINSPHLEEIVLELSVDCADDIDDAPMDIWLGIDEVLNRPRFECVRRVELLTFCRVDVEAVADLIKKRLPACEKRGILRFR